MGLFSNRVDKSQIKPGDHIYAYRFRHRFSHHGIYVGADRVIHYTKTQAAKKILALFRKTKCVNCGHQPDKARGVIKTCVDCFLDGHRLYRFEYGVELPHFLFKKPGTCTTALSDSAHTVIARATELLNKEQGFGDYNLFTNNCESFAFFCKTEERLSVQAYCFKRDKVVFMARLLKDEMWWRSYARTMSDGRPAPWWRTFLVTLFMPLVPVQKSWYL